MPSGNAPPAWGNSRREDPGSGDVNESESEVLGFHQMVLEFGGEATDVDRCCHKTEPIRWAPWLRITRFFEVLAVYY